MTIHSLDASRLKRLHDKGLKVEKTVDFSQKKANSEAIYKCLLILKGLVTDLIKRREK